jgi:hypothetical protein
MGSRVRGDERSGTVSVHTPEGCAFTGDDKMDHV